MKKLYSEKEIKESCIKVKRLLPDSDAMDNNFSLQYFNAEISKDFTRKDLKRIAVNKSKFVVMNAKKHRLWGENMLLVIESIVLCLIFTLMVYIMSRKPIKTPYNYPPKIQERVRELDEYKD